VEERLRRYVSTGAGDVKRLVGRDGTRLRVGDFRVIFVETADVIEVRAVGDRRDVYRWVRPLMGQVQIIKTDAGEELVVLARRDYDTLAARAGEDVSEDAVTARILDESDARLAEGEDVALPEAVWEALESGQAPVRVLREFRRMSVETLAVLAGLAPADVDLVEARGEVTDAVRARLAIALKVPADLLAEH
jgi:mRNA interferase RelE/StbE